MVLTTFKTTQDVHEGPKLPPTATTPSDASGQWEWRVKVRKDGTRYVTRRPAASKAKFLRERAQRVTEERSSGMTTDDDAVSEFKVGKLFLEMIFSPYFYVSFSVWVTFLASSLFQNGP